MAAVAPHRTITLLGRPGIEGESGPRRMRSRKSWALLTYLLLCERPPTRRWLAGLMFGQAQDPLGALRWGLAEVRRALEGDASLEGDPVVLRLSPGTLVDASVVLDGPWSRAVQVPTLGCELLEGFTMSGAATFETWLLCEQRRQADAAAGALRSAVADAVEAGAVPAAIAYAVRLLGLAPLDETSHALLIRLYRSIGDDVGARRQMLTCEQALAAEIGARPGPEVLAALARDPRPGDVPRQRLSA